MYREPPLRFPSPFFLADQIVFSVTDARNSKSHQTGKRAKEKSIQYKTEAPPKYDITQGAEPGTSQVYPKCNGLGSIPPILELSRKSTASVTWNRTGPQPAGLAQALELAATARGPQLNRRRNVKQWPYNHLKTASAAPA